MSVASMSNFRWRREAPLTVVFSARIALMNEVS
jgi:hypothetical protein